MTKTNNLSDRSNGSSLGSRLMREEGGAIMIAGLFMSLMMVAGMYYMIGISEAIKYRIAMQDAADSTAFSSAIIHARGMNLVVLVNLILLSAMTLKTSMRVIATFGLAVALANVSQTNSSAETFDGRGSGTENTQYSTSQLSYIQSVATKLTREANRLEGVDDTTGRRIASGGGASTGVIDQITSTLSESATSLTYVMPEASLERAKEYAQMNVRQLDNAFVNPIASFLPLRKPPVSIGGSATAATQPLPAGGESRVPNGMNEFCDRVADVALPIVQQATSTTIGDHMRTNDVSRALWDSMYTKLASENFTPDTMRWFCGVGRTGSFAPSVGAEPVPPRISVPFSFQHPALNASSAADCSRQLDTFLANRVNDEQDTNVQGMTLADIERLGSTTFDSCKTHNDSINSLRNHADDNVGGYQYDGSSVSYSGGGDIQSALSALNSSRARSVNSACNPWNSGARVVQQYQHLEANVVQKRDYERTCYLLPDPDEDCPPGVVKGTDSYVDGTTGATVATGWCCSGGWNQTRLYYGMENAQVPPPGDVPPCTRSGATWGAPTFSGGAGAGDIYWCQSSALGRARDANDWDSGWMDRGSFDLAAGTAKMRMTTETNPGERPRAVMAMLSCVELKNSVKTQINMPGANPIQAPLCRDCPFVLDWSDPDMSMADPRFQLRGYVRSNDAWINRVINYDQIVNITSATGAFGVTASSSENAATIPVASGVRSFQDVTEAMRVASRYSGAQAEFFFQAPAGNSRFGNAYINRSEWPWHMQWTARMTLLRRDQDVSASRGGGPLDSDVRQQCRQIGECKDMSDALDAPGAIFPMNDSRTAH